MKFKEIFLLIIIFTIIQFGFEKPSLSTTMFGYSKGNTIINCTTYNLKRGMKAYNFQVSPLGTNIGLVKRIDFLSPDKNKKLWLSISRGPESKKTLKFKPFAELKESSNQKTEIIRLETLNRTDLEKQLKLPIAITTLLTTENLNELNAYKQYDNFFKYYISKEIDLKKKSANTLKEILGIPSSQGIDFPKNEFYTVEEIENIQQNLKQTKVSIDFLEKLEFEKNLAKTNSKSINLKSKIKNLDILEQVNEKVEIQETLKKLDDDVEYSKISNSPLPYITTYANSFLTSIWSKTAEAVFLLPKYLDQFSPDDREIIIKDVINGFKISSDYKNQSADLHYKEILNLSDIADQLKSNKLSINEAIEKQNELKHTFSPIPVIPGNPTTIIGYEQKKLLDEFLQKINSTKFLFQPISPVGLGGDFDPRLSNLAANSTFYDRIANLLYMAKSADYETIVENLDVLQNLNSLNNLKEELNISQIHPFMLRELVYRAQLIEKFEVDLKFNNLLQCEPIDFIDFTGYPLTRYYGSKFYGY